MFLQLDFEENRICEHGNTFDGYISEYSLDITLRGFLELTIKQEEIEKIYFFVEGDEDYGIKEREFFLDNPNMMRLVISQLLTWERETIGDRNFCGQMPKSVGVYSYYGLVCIIQYRDKRLSWQKIYIKLDHNVSDERNQTLKDPPRPWL